MLSTLVKNLSYTKYKGKNLNRSPFSDRCLIFSLLQNFISKLSEFQEVKGIVMERLEDIATSYLWAIIH